MVIILINRFLEGVKNPIYISVGNNIALKDAVALVAYTRGVSRIPEPVREADLFLVAVCVGGLPWLQ